MDKVAISDLLAKSISKLSKVLGKGKSNFPRFVFSCGNKSSKSVNLILILSKIFCHGNETFKAKNSDVILLILRELSEEWKKFLDQVRLL